MHTIKNIQKIKKIILYTKIEKKYIEKIEKKIENNSKKQDK